MFESPDLSTYSSLTSNGAMVIGQNNPPSIGRVVSAKLNDVTKSHSFQKQASLISSPRFVSDQRISSSTTTALSKDSLSDQENKIPVIPTPNEEGKLPLFAYRGLCDNSALKRG